MNNILSVIGHQPDLHEIRFEIKLRNGLGISYRMHDQYPQAVEHFYAALKLALRNSYLLYAEDSYNSLGIIYKESETMLYDSINTEESVASCLENLGILYDA
jgi:hypothetical protein